MAEAHSATAIPFIKDLDEGKDTYSDVVRAWRRYVKRKIYRTRNSINNGMWPTSIYNLAFIILLANFLIIMDHESMKFITNFLWKFEIYIFFIKDIPYVFRVAVLTFLFGFVFFMVLMFVRRYILRIMLSYRGWLYEPPHSQSYKTIIWACIVRMIGGYSPSLYSCQASLPRMHVPPLRQTLRQLMESLKPHYDHDSEKLTRLLQQSKEFEKTLGTKLQKILILKSWLYPNYVTDWWEKYVYLMNRSPLLINSNYYGLDHSYYQPTQLQCSRAGMVMHLLAEFYKLLYREQVNPLFIRNTIPVCMAQYDRMFATCRIPNIEIDELKHFDPQKIKHVIVHRKGILYILNLLDKSGRIYPPSFLERQFEWIIDDADSVPKDDASRLNNLCCLTGQDRITWANQRKMYFSSGINKTNLNWIESAIVFVSLETESGSTLAERGLIGMCSPNIWADKSISFIIMDNAKISMNAEHTWGDAPVMGHLMEYIYAREVMPPRNLYDSDGHCMDVTGCFLPRDKSEPLRLKWDFSPSLSDAIASARLFCKKNADDVDLVILDFRGFGKGFIKTCKVSPDAFIQVSLHLAYYRMHRKFPMTYEASMTRLYLCGRTETVRSLTQESADFILSMMADNVDRRLKIRLLRRACDIHQHLYRESMAGKGCDRHLFALYVLSKGLGYENEFLKEVLSVPWVLSTSQQPQQQTTMHTSCDLPEYRDVISPGGGFGPVSDMGYGVSYMIPGDFKFFFHISSKKRCLETDSSLFRDHLITSLHDIKALFDAPTL